MRVLITGSAGFIGFHITRRLLAEGHTAVGIDNISPYYDPALKEQRLSRLLVSERYTHHRSDIRDADALDACMAEARPDVIVHMAAQAGVRHSIEAPLSYIETNISGLVTLLQAVKRTSVRHVLAASSSSVYGMVSEPPSSEDDTTDQPLSVYAASKKASELIGHSYAHLFGIRLTFLRFFTVYGPWGRPDMALLAFARAISSDQPVSIYDGGKQLRDFTCIDDVVEAVSRLIPLPPDPHRPRALNIGRGEPCSVLDLLAALENSLGKPARRIIKPAQQGDVPCTHACTDRLRALTGYAPSTPLSEGVAAFADWYVRYSADSGAVE